MLKNKFFIIMAIITVVLVVAFVVITAVTHVDTPEIPDDEITDTDTSNGSDETSSETETNTDIVVPPVSTDESTTPTDKPDIDITDMGRNPNAEVVDSSVEYGTKEVDSDAE